MREDQFWSFVDQSAGPDGCWPWLRMRNRNGYGRLVFGGTQQTWELAHRTAYRLANGPIPTGVLILHSCDNPPCCNPAHLRPGTNSDNMRDMFAHGRREPLWVTRSISTYARGEQVERSKLTADQVLEIRRRLAAGESQGQLSKVFPVKQAAISSIARRETWKHI